MRGYVTDAPDDDTTMEDPEAEIYINLSVLEPNDALALISALGIDRCEVTDDEIGALFRGEDVTDELGDAIVHLTADQAISALVALGVVEAGNPERNEPVSDTPDQQS